MQGLWQIECFQHITPHCVTRLVSGYSVSFLLLSFKTVGGALRRQRAFHAQAPPLASGSPTVMLEQQKQYRLRGARNLLKHLAERDSE